MAPCTYSIPYAASGGVIHGETYGLYGGKACFVQWPPKKFPNQMTTLMTTLVTTLVSGEKNNFVSDKMPKNSRRESTYYSPHGGVHNMYMLPYDTTHKLHNNANMSTEDFKRNMLRRLASIKRKVKKSGKRSPNRQSQRRRRR